MHIAFISTLNATENNAAHLKYQFNVDISYDFEVCDKKTLNLVSKFSY